MQKRTGFLLGTLVLIAACQKNEPSPFPPFEDAANIVVDGQRISSMEYFKRYCHGKPGGADDKYCKAAVEQNSMEFVRPSGNSQSTTQTTGRLGEK